MMLCCIHNKEALTMTVWLMVRPSKPRDSPLLCMWVVCFAHLPEDLGLWTWMKDIAACVAAASKQRAWIMVTCAHSCNESLG